MDNMHFAIVIGRNAPLQWTIIGVFTMQEFPRTGRTTVTYRVSTL